MARTAKRKPKKPKKPNKKPSPAKDITRSLLELARTLGFDARLDSEVAGDRGYYQREDMDLDELYDTYWDANYKGTFLSALLAIPAELRPSVDETIAAARERYRAATRNGRGTRAYEDSLPRPARHSSSRRRERWRYFNGTKAVAIEELTAAQIAERLR